MEKSLAKLANYIMNLVLITACFVHLCYLGYYVLYPEYPTIAVYEKDLKDIDFPLSFRLCVNEPRNGLARFKSVGYRTYASLFFGISMYNDTVYGWKGHFENGSTFNSVEGNISGKFMLF